MNMSILDMIKNAFKSAAKDAVKDAAKKAQNPSVSFKFDTLPATLDELKALPEASLDTPYKAAALTVCALNAYMDDPDTGIEMLNFLKGPQPLTPREKQFLKDRRDYQKYVAISYFAGAKPENDYTPDVPYVLSVSANPYSFNEEKYATLWLTSGGADSPRQVKLRAKGDQWFLWEHMLLPGIRKTKSEDPWA